MQQTCPACTFADGDVIKVPCSAAVLPQVLLASRTSLHENLFGVIELRLCRLAQTGLAYRQQRHLAGS